MASAVGPGNGTSQDFSALADAHGEVVSHLLQDEAQNTTLYSQLLDNPGGAAHGYFCEPHTADQLGSPLEVRSTIPLPAELLDLQQRMQVATFMGLLPELNHAWLSVDNALLLWNYVDGADVVKKFQELEQVIVAVGLAVPRQGVFKPLVKYLLVVATPVEVVLVAVTDGGDGRLDVRPTQFSASSDGVNMNAIRGHPCGRIFMAGKDGNLYELIYEAGGATGWLSYVGLGGSSGSRKCRKINRSTTPSSAVWNSFKQILPGGGAGAASLLDLAVDPLRNALYTVDSTGVLRHYNLGPDGQQTVPVGGDLDLWAAAGQFCRLHSTNRAQDVPDARAFEPGHGLEAVALSVVDACEDACVHLVVVASSGMRVYLGPSGRASEIDTAQATSPLRVLHVRAPPPAALWEHRKALASLATGAAPPSQPPTGFAAGATRGGSAAGTGGRGGNAATAAYYAHRVMVVAQRAAGRGRGGGGGGGLGLVAICESGVARLDQPQVSLAETALEIDPAGGVLAIEEHPTVLGDPATASLLALTYTSGTPSAHNEIARQLAEANEDAPVAPPSARSQRAAHPPRAADGDPNAPPAGEVPPPPSLCLPPRGWLGGLRGARGVVPLRELATQHAAPQRRLLCLSGAGLHMVAKLRPLDVLHRLLRSAPPRPDLLQLFFDSYGHAEACAMCFAIACGLPNDATAPPETLPPTDVRRRVTAGPSAATRAAAVDALQRLGGAAHFAGSGDGDAGAAGGGSGDHGGMNGNGGGGGGGAVFNEEFRHSAQYLGLAQFLARLLRPAWFRPVAVAAVPLQGAPAAQPQQQQRDARGGGTLPGDITLTLSEGDLEGMVEPLRELVALLRRVYRVAVQEDWLSKPRPQHRGAYGTAAGHPDSAVARAAAQRARAAEALRRECVDVHRAYRLASRALQALKLLGILLDLRRKHPQCRAKWSALANVRLSQLVVGRGAHAAAERLLAGLVGAQSGLGGDAEGHLARALRQECYLYFSQGDVLAHEGTLALSQAEEKEAVDPGSVDARAESDRAVKLLTHAAEFWRGPRAAAPGGPLQLACARLARLRRYDGVGRVCLACAANFAGDEVVGRPSWSAGADDLRTLGGWSPPPDVPRWELELYHGGSVGDAKGRDAAVEAVHGVLLGYLEDLVSGAAGADIRPGESPEEAARRREWDADALISHTSNSKDDVFHARLYALLLRRDRVLLLRVSGERLEPWLRANDADLLHQLLRQRGQYAKAALLELELAQEDGVPLEKRIAHLALAAADIRGVRAGDNFMDVDGSAVRYSREELASLPKLANVEGMLEMAHIQRDVKACLESTAQQLLSAAEGSAAQADGARPPPRAAVAKAMRDEAQRRAAAAAVLDAALLEATPLYNDYARRFAVWDACLVTIAACASDDAAEVEALWRALVWRAVPLRAGWEKAQDWLNGTRASRDRPIMQDTAARLLGARSATLFEETGWQADLQAQVSALGQQLLSKPGGAAAFPLPLLVAELEELALHHAYAVAQRAKTDTEAAGQCMTWATVVVDTVAEPWPLEALLGAAPEAHAEVFAAYSNAARANERASGDKQLQLTVQVSRLVQSWLAAAADGGAAAVGGGGGASTAAASLAAANANGALARRIGDLRMRLMALPNISTKRSAAAQASAVLSAALQEVAKRGGGGAARDAAAAVSTAGGFPALMWR